MPKRTGINKSVWVTLGIAAAVAGGVAGSQVETMGQAYDLARKRFSEAEVERYDKEITGLTWDMAGERANQLMDLLSGKDTDWRERKIDSMAKRVNDLRFERYRVGEGRLSFLENFKAMKQFPKFFKPTMPKTNARMKHTGMGAAAGAAFVAAGAAAAAIRRRKSYTPRRR